LKAHPINHPTSTKPLAVQLTVLENGAMREPWAVVEAGEAPKGAAAGAPKRPPPVAGGGVPKGEEAAHRR
jgi:hypothetical protein